MGWIASAAIENDGMDSGLGLESLNVALSGYRIKERHA
jgi:hypothetical protein